MDTKTMIITVICSVISSGLLNAILSHLLYNNKLTKDLKYKGNDRISHKIQDSLDFVREVELKLKEIEIFDVSNVLKKKEEKIDFFNGETIYLSIFNTEKTFYDYMDLIKECRDNYEKYLSRKISLNLSYMEKYLLKVITFIKCYGGKKSLQFWGTVFIFDFQKWQQKMEKMLIKEINKHDFKLYNISQKKYNKLFNSEITKQYKKTILYCLCEDIADPNKLIIKNHIMDTYYNIFENSN